LSPLNTIVKIVSFPDIIFLPMISESLQEQSIKRTLFLWYHYLFLFLI